MAESDTILQLGIEAAREGNREEARNLFGLLTRQEPNNVQAWLWLAGVADGPEQRRAALERVVELDPTNEMAVKGLQAMGATPGARSARSDTAPAASAPPPPAPAREMTDEERYAAELDSAFDDDYAAIPRAEPSPRPVMDDTTAVDEGAPARRGSGTARQRSAARRGTTPVRSSNDDDDLVPARSGPNWLLLALSGIILILIIFLAYRFLTGGGTETPPSPDATAIAANATNEAATAAAALSTPEPIVTPSPEGGGVVTPTAELTSTAEVSPTAGTQQPGGQQPGGQQPGGQPPTPVANPNMQIVSIGTILQANGWSYTYPDPSYVLVLGKQVGSFTAQGTYVHVLVWVANNTGTTQPLPPNFFALKDANNKVYLAAPQVASAAVQRGVNADVGMEDPIPANGALTSVYLVFDVAPGATNVQLFTTANNSQGWTILDVVP
jgi:hypothetical protein